MNKTFLRFGITLLIIVACTFLLIPIIKHSIHESNAKKEYSEYYIFLSNVDNYNGSIENFLGKFRELQERYKDTKAQIEVLSLMEEEALRLKNRLDKQIRSLTTSEDEAMKTYEFISTYFADTLIKKESDIEIQNIHITRKKIVDENEAALRKQKEEERIAKKQKEEEEKIFRAEFESYKKLVPRISEYAYKEFTAIEREKILRNNIDIGDKESMILYLNGSYKREITKSEYGETHHYYGRNYARYSYITAVRGRIDYISY